MWISSIHTFFSLRFFAVSVDKPFKLSTLIYIIKLTTAVFLLYIDHDVKMCITDSKREKSTKSAKEIPTFHIVIHNSDRHKHVFHMSFQENCVSFSDNPHIPQFFPHNHDRTFAAVGKAGRKPHGPGPMGRNNSK